MIGLVVNNLSSHMLHLLLAFPSSRLETRSHKRLAAASYFVAVGLGLPTLLFADMTDPDLCGCPDNLLMVQDSLRPPRSSAQCRSSRRSCCSSLSPTLAYRLPLSRPGRPRRADR